MNIDDFCTDAQREEEEKFTEVLIGEFSFIISTDRECLPGLNGYDIEFHRVDSLEKLYDWIFHLTGKGNIHPHTIHRLILAAENRFGYRMPSMRED